MQMQTPRTSAKGPAESARKISPRSSFDTTPRSSSRVVRQLKTTGLEPNSSSNVSSPKTPKTTKISPKSPAPELQKKRVGRIAELKAQINQLEDALRTVKDQLILSESWKKQAKQDAQESREQLLVMSLKLQESQKLVDRETYGVRELHAEEQKPKPNSTDSTALAAALLEVDQLKVKLDTVIESEATQMKQVESANSEIQILKEKMAETLSIKEGMKNELHDCKNSESQAQALANETLLQLETAKKAIESLKIIEKTKQKDQETESEVIIALKSELGSLKSAERQRHEDIENLKANLMDKETELQGICEENDNLNAKLANLKPSNRENELQNEIKRSKEELDGLNSKLTSLELESCEKLDENDKLKSEMKKMEEELKRVKVQMDQWRKAAEAATAMLCNENNDENNMMVERTWSMGNYKVEIDDDDEDEFLKKKNGNVLKRIGVLWKKPQNK